MIRKLLHLSVIVLLLHFLYPGTIKAENPGNDKNPLVVVPSNLTIKVGKTCDFKVKCTAEKNARVEEQCGWEILPDSLGTFNGPEFSALKAGDGMIAVTYKDYTDTISVKVLADNDHENSEEGKEKEEKEKEEKGHYPKITFNNDKWIKLSVGESATIHPVYWVSEDSTSNVEFSYSLSPAIIGAVSEDGILVAEYPGTGKVGVSFEAIEAEIKVQVKKDKTNKEGEYPLLKIITSRVNIKSGEFVELMAAYYDSTGLRTEVSPDWAVHPSDLGHFTDSIFYADSMGKGYILAAYEGLTDSIPLNVQEPKTYDDVWSAFRIVIQPGDTTIAAGDSLQYTLLVQNKKNWNMVIDSTLLDSITVQWSLVGNDVGTISEDGLLTTQSRGYAVVKAMLNDEKAITTRVIVTPANSDTTELNTVEIQRVLPNGNILPSKTVLEGESYKITGLPYPLNVLNGGLLNFPVGSLSEDISIFMMLPEQIKEDSSNVVHEDSVLAGVKFVVSINDSIVEPYYFDTPLILSLPYKTEILDSLGIDPEEIGVFFSEDGDYTNSGITNVVIDTVENRIIAEVEHFSSIILRQDISKQTKANPSVSLPRGIAINKPNPFVTSTTFEFELKSVKNVRLIIYNVQGQTIKEFALGRTGEGKHEIHWDGTDNNGTPVKPGLYFGTFLENGKRNKVSKIIKLGL